MKIRVSSSENFHLSGAIGAISFLLFFLEREIGSGKWQRVAERGVIRVLQAPSAIKEIFNI